MAVDTKRKRRPGGGRRKGSRTSIDKRYENYLMSPSRQVANDVACLTWPFMNGGRKPPEIEVLIRRAIENWMFWNRALIKAELSVKRSVNGWDHQRFFSEVDAAIRKLRKPNAKQVCNLLRAKRTAVPTYESHKRGPPIEISDEERRSILEEYHRLGGGRFKLWEEVD